MGHDLKRLKNDLLFWNQHTILNKKNVGDKYEYEIPTELHDPTLHVLDPPHII